MIYTNYIMRLFSLDENKDKCERIVLILDSSGSMNSQKRDVVAGINETIRQQRKLNQEDNSKVLFNIVSFNDNVLSPTNDTLESIRYLSDRDYNPTGSTALYDAIGLTINRYRDERNVIFLIMTDGEENASRKYNYEMITGLIKEMKDYKNWNFIYLSEDIKTFKQAESIGVSNYAYNCNNVLTEKNKLGQTLSTMGCQKAIYDMRSGKKNVKIGL